MRRVFVAAVALVAMGACGGSGGTGTQASPTPPSGFARTGVSGGSANDAPVTSVSVAHASGYDRFVIEFGGAIPSYSATIQPNATFTRSPKGDQVTLEGTSGVVIVVHSVSNWTSYSGPTEFHPRYPYLRQATQIENYEGYQQWALGIQGDAYLRVTTLSSPDRLVVDVAAT